MIDLRSDTVTRPCQGMRQAMANAEVGDDVYGDDPTVNRLEQETAEKLGQEDALFVSSGTQANLIALLAHCPRGSEFVTGDGAHNYRYEAGGAAALGGLHTQTLPYNEHAEIDLNAVRSVVKPIDVHFPKTRLLCLENTQDGRALSVAYVNQAVAQTRELGLQLHMDGARLFNAAIARNVAVDSFSASCDSVCVCLSKGLGAPAGSLLAGSQEFVREARHWRKMLGGGMRQAGVLAAAGHFALENNVARLAEDHEHASIVAEVLRDRFPERVKQNTNMVFIDLQTTELELLSKHMQHHGVRAPRSRWVLHKDVSAADVERICQAVKALAS